ncbi:MAG: hypothetical protein LR001_07065 [Clostridiales bacterium]|nr:hypothetical protein [Clostridiales bacterium]
MDKYSFCKKTVKEITAKINNNVTNGRRITSVRKTHVDKQILVILAADINNQTVNELAKFRRYGIKVHLLLAREISSKVNKDVLCKKIGITNLYYNSEICDVEEILIGIDLVIMAVSDLTYVSKLSQGIQDDLVSKVIYKALSTNKQIYIDLGDVKNKTNVKNTELKKIFDEQLSIAKKMGIKEILSSEYLIRSLRFFKVSSNTISHTTNKKDLSRKNYSKEVITEGDISRIEKDVRVLNISAGTIVTALARDLASRRGIKIVLK